MAGKRKLKQTPPKVADVPTDATESEIDGLRRTLKETIAARDVARAELRSSQDEVTQLKGVAVSLYKSQERLLTALIADGDALKLYRQQSLDDVRSRIAKVDVAQVAGALKNAWSGFAWNGSAFEWRPID